MKSQPVNRLKEIVEEIISYQNKKNQTKVGHVFIPVDIWLKNGNILLRAFNIIEVTDDSLVGITLSEIYSSYRENRIPQFSRFHFEEINKLTCFDLDIAYNSEGNFHQSFFR